MKSFKTVLLLLIVVVFFPAYQASAGAPIVDPYQVYSYEQMLKDIERIQQTYPDIVETDLLGRTEFGRVIWAVKLGSGEPSVFINGSHHAREWITTNITMKMLDRYARAYTKNENYGGYNVRELLDNISIWFVPMVSPDGVVLQQEGLSAFPAEVHDVLVAMNNGSTDFRRWKANALGVDNNRQYPKNWDLIKYVPGQTVYNVWYRSPSKPSYAYYKGEKPFTELENIALRDFTYEIDPEIALSYHSSGRVIYFPSDSPHQQIARGLADLTGYRLVPLNQPAAGYTDWFVDEFNRPAYTPELSYHVGPTNPPLSVIPEEWQRNKYVGLYAAQKGLELSKGRDPGSTGENVYQSGLISLQKAGVAHQNYISHMYFNGSELMIPVRAAEEIGFDVSYSEAERMVALFNGMFRYRICLYDRKLKVRDDYYLAEIRPPGTMYVPAGSLKKLDIR